MPRPPCLWPSLFLGLFALVCLAPAPGAQADEPDEGTAVRRAAAEEIGRDMLAPDEDVRRRAVSRLLEHIEAGGDLGAFLDDLAQGAHAWADRRERLVEVWIREAVHGDMAARESAARLLAAVGPDAIRRLASELRHALRHAAPGPGGDGAADEADAPDGSAAAGESAAAATGKEEGAFTPELAAGTPRLYDVRDLFARGFDAVQLRSLLEKGADAVQVKQFDRVYVVTAEEAGHAALRKQLEALRAAPPQPGGALLPTPPAPGQGGETAPAPAKPEPQQAPQAVPDAPQAPAAGADLRRWRLVPRLFHLPKGTLDRGDLGLPPGLDAGKTQALPADASQAERWVEALLRVPNARADQAWVGPDLVGVGVAADLFSGRELRYSRDVQPTRGGAWTIVQGTLRHGLALDVGLVPAGADVELTLVATRTEVGQPIPVVQVRPAPDTAPVELERPEWTTLRVRTTVRLASTGGSAFVTLGDLGGPPDEQAVLVLTLQPVP